SGFVDADALSKIAALPSVDRVAATRMREIRIATDKVPLTVLARDRLESDPGAQPPLIAHAPSLDRRLPPAWISEAAADLHGWKQGTTIELPLGPTRAPFAVAGIWRDYTRQNGTVVIDRARYVAATGDT